MSGEHYKVGEFQAWDVTRYMSGNMAQALQYVLRCDIKSVGAEATQDLQKAIDFIENWAANNDIPAMGSSIDVIQTEHVLNEILHRSSEWKRQIVKQIFWADMVGDLTGGLETGQQHMTSNVIPAIRAEIARRENAA
ncbi:hypothetical protein [Acetobacter sp. DsW_063]|uniref:hypothetical protein n=1 Tax=Acetobacter sp. DsW_063 TaxID=1514894 RepID=UPI000A37DE77|nr:hypothetical protein [Acetobacter sp. DsW_063]OUJ16384.1 hypothetical protein HK28_00150 [Acetobacter sp. DsW_063]